MGRHSHGWSRSPSRSPPPSRSSSARRSSRPHHAYAPPPPGYGGPPGAPHHYSSRPSYSRARSRSRSRSPPPPPRSSHRRGPSPPPPPPRMHSSSSRHSHSHSHSHTSSRRAYDAPLPPLPLDRRSAPSRSSYAHRGHDDMDDLDVDGRPYGSSRRSHGGHEYESRRHTDARDDRAPRSSPPPPRGRTPYPRPPPPPLSSSSARAAPLSMRASAPSGRGEVDEGLLPTPGAPPVPEPMVMPGGPPDSADREAGELGEVPPSPMRRRAPAYVDAPRPSPPPPPPPPPGYSSGRSSRRPPSPSYPAPPPRRRGVSRDPVPYSRGSSPGARDRRMSPAPYDRARSPQRRSSSSRHTHDARDRDPRDRDVRDRDLRDRDPHDRDLRDRDPRERDPRDRDLRGMSPPRSSRRPPGAPSSSSHRALPPPHSPPRRSSRRAPSPLPPPSRRSRSPSPSWSRRSRAPPPRSRSRSPPPYSRSGSARYAAFPPSRSPTPPPPMRMRSPPPSRRSRSPPPPPPMMRMRTPPPIMRPRSPAPMPVPIPIPMAIPPPPPVAAALDVLDVAMAPLPAPGELAATPAADPAYIVAPTPPTGPDYYETLAQVGEGTYGKVFRARHPKTGQLVALKRIRIEKDRDGFPITAVREMQLLQQVKHPNIIALNDVALETVACVGGTAESPTATSAPAPMGQPQTYVYMVFEYMQHDLAGILQHPHVRFRAEHIKSLVQQLMQALAFLHARGIMHRDIKGSNMLLNRHGELKLADFGLARQVLSTVPPPAHHHAETDAPAHGKPALEMTNRVITLWYRPIELLLGSTRYAPAIDLWSAGCILLELFLHRPAFPGTDELSQIEHVYKACGSPNVVDWPDVVDLQWFELMRPSAPKPRRLRHLFGAAFMLESGSGSTAVPADHAIADGETPASAAAAFELVDALLQLNPAHRPSAAQALDHTYFRTAPWPVPPRSVLETLDDADHWHEFESKQRKRAAAVAAPVPTNDAGSASSPAHVVTSVRPPRSGKRTAVAAGTTAPSLRVSATVAHAASTLALARAAAALDAQQPPGLGGGGASRFAALALASAEGVPAPLVELALARCPTPPPEPEPEPEPMEVEPVVDVKMEDVCEAPLGQRKESSRQRDPLSPRRSQPMPVDARETRLDTTIQFPNSVDVTKVVQLPKPVDAAKLVASPKPLEPSKPVTTLAPSRPLEKSMPLDTSIPDLMDIDDAEAVAAEMLLGLANQARLSQTDLPAVRAPPANDTSMRPTEPTNGLPPITSPVTSPSRQAPAPGDPASTGTTDATTTDATMTDVPATPAKPAKRRRIVRGTPAESIPMARVLPGPATAEPVPPPPREAIPPSTSPAAAAAAAPALAAPPVETTPTTDADVTPPVAISPAPADPAAPEPAPPARRTSRRQAAARVQSYASLHAGVYDEGIFEARLPSSASSPPPPVKRARKATSCFGPPPAPTPRARKKSADADGGDRPRARKKVAAEVVSPASVAPPGMPMEVVTVQSTPRKQPGRPRIRVVPGAPPPPPPTPAGVVVVGSVDVPSTSAAAAAPGTAAANPVKEEEGTLTTSTVEEEEVKVENV